jgi:hypothetical protein
VVRWRFAIGDVCGTGPEAAAVTGLARHALRILAAEGYGIAEVVGRLNDMIVNEGRFLTLLHGEISIPPAGPLRVSLVCAGHPLPLLLPASEARPPWPAAQPQPLLGVMSECSFVSSECELHPGDVLLCVTDGITERRAGDRLLDDDDGLARLVSGWRGLTAAAIVARVRHAAEEFGTEPASDDMAILAIRARSAAEGPSLLPGSGLELGREDLAAQRAFHETDRARGRGEARTLPAVGGQHRVDGVRRERLGQLAARGAVSLAGALDARVGMVPRHRGERRWMPPEHAVQAVVGRDDIEQPGDGGRLEILAAGRVNPGRPTRWYVRRHTRSIAAYRIDILVRMCLPCGTGEVLA